MLIGITLSQGCRDPLPREFGFILLPMAIGGFGAIIGARFAQIPGMILCAGVGHGEN